MSLENHVIAYGMDERGDFFPLPASSSPDFSAFKSLPKKYSAVTIVNGADDDVGFMGLDVAAGAAVYVHSIELLASDDEPGLVPLNSSGLLGIGQAGFFLGLELSVGAAWSQSLMTGSIAELATATNSQPVIANSVDVSPFRWVGGSVEIGQLLENWQPEDISISVTGGGSGYLRARAVYSLVRLA